MRPEEYDMKKFRVKHGPLPTNGDTLEIKVKRLAKKGMDSTAIAESLYKTKNVNVFDNNRPLHTNGFVRFLDKIKGILETQEPA
ncbi:hypothetical protein [Bythopirellula polymerisocia]|uniref:Uncharacterized protein n=1 Tax=Bythopirellula polymerisocia TaxID=2528003 RepID=A0A5C6C0D4_9BACT|nr:hypothetical protein [Bythopirellula polymerisocia]TWU17598.1 hypothetical protein Pla144_51000 [Bythopirellula polymerisocia]